VQSTPAAGKAPETKRTATAEVPVARPGAGFNEVSVGLDGAPAPRPATPAPTTPPTTTPPTTTPPQSAPVEAAKNHGQARAELAHALNTLRQAVQFANHKGNPNVAKFSDQQLRDAISTVAKTLNVNLGDISKKTGLEALNLLASKLGAQAGSPPTGSTGSTGSPSGSTGSASAQPADPNALFEQIVQKAFARTAAKL
ncbi:MAG TPA: hypothetical protein VK447_11745, partial [Myxococcaceae bacterium]|nr:hypothetical protein [Myxococcaceae bacterium]